MSMGSGIDDSSILIGDLIMSLHSLKAALLGLMLAIGIPLSTAQVQAHGGLSLADDICKLTIGPYTMHFTGYQPESTQEKEFCEDIPATGRTVVALDYIEEACGPCPPKCASSATPAAAAPDGKNSKTWTPSPSCISRPRSTQRLHQLRIRLHPARQIRRPGDRGRQGRIRLALPLLRGRAQRHLALPHRRHRRA